MRLVSKSFLIKKEKTVFLNNTVSQYFLAKNFDVIHWAITNVDKNDNIVVNATLLQ